MSGITRIITAAWWMCALALVGSEKGNGWARRCQGAGAAPWSAGEAPAWRMSTRGGQSWGSRSARSRGVEREEEGGEDRRGPNAKRGAQGWRATSCSGVLLLRGGGAGSDVSSLDEEGEARVKRLLENQEEGGKVRRRKERKKMKMKEAVTFEEMAKYDPRKRTGVEWVERASRGGMTSWREMHMQVESDKIKGAAGDGGDGGDRKRRRGGQGGARSVMRTKLLRAIAGGRGGQAAQDKVRELLEEVEGGKEWDPKRHGEKMGKLAKFLDAEGGDEDEERHPFEGEEMSGFEPSSSEGGALAGYTPQSFTLGATTEDRSGEEELEADDGGSVEWECEYCGRMYPTETIAIAHEKRCASRIKNQAKGTRERQGAGNNGSSTRKKRTKLDDFFRPESKEEDNKSDGEVAVDRWAATATAARGGDSSGEEVMGPVDADALLKTKLPLGKSEGMYDGLDIDELLGVARAPPQDAVNSIAVEIPRAVIDQMKVLALSRPSGMMAARLSDEWKAKYGTGCPWAELGFERQGSFLKAMEGKAVKLWRRGVGDDYKVFPLSTWVPQEREGAAGRGDQDEETAERVVKGNVADFFDKNKDSGGDGEDGDMGGGDGEDGDGEDEDDMYLDSADRIELENDFGRDDDQGDGMEGEEGPAKKKLGKRQREAGKRRRFRDLSEMADGGDAESIFKVAQCYEDGIGVRQDEDRAVEMYQEAVAASGKKKLHTRAMTNLGYCYMEGRGVPVSHDRGFEAFRSASDAGEILATYNLAKCFLEGHGCVKDPTTAFEMFFEAAEAGLPVSMAAVGICYRDGVGTSVDTAKATAWFEKGSGAGDAECSYHTACMLLEAGGEGRGVGAREGDRKAIALLQANAAKGDKDAIFMLGSCTAHGRGVPRADPARGIRMVEKAAAGGVVAAMRTMAEAHEEGFGVLKDKERSEMWRRKAEGFAA